MNLRYCRIESASVETAAGAGDGAYGLVEIEGNPLQISEAIALELSESDLTCGPERQVLSDDNDELYLNLRIRFANHPLPSTDGN